MTIQTIYGRNMNIINEEEIVYNQRKKRTCNDIPSHAIVKNLQLNKCSEIHDFLKAACTKSILKHILFSRGIISCTVDELLRSNKVDRGNDDKGLASVFLAKKQTRSEVVHRRKHEKITQEICALLSDFDDIFRLLKNGCEEFIGRGDEARSSSGVKAVIITIGPSFSSPKEQYLIRFYEWEDLNSNDIIVAPHSFSSKDQDRLGQEMGRRSVKELVDVTLEDEFCEMFQTTKYGHCTNGNAKVNVACLVRQSSADRLFRSKQNSVVVLDTNDIPSSSFSIPFMMNRNLEVKEPRMYSKSKGLHRPFFVLDVIPNLKPTAYDCDKNAVATFVQEQSDVWIQFRHTVKGLRL